MGIFRSSILSFVTFMACGGLSAQETVQNERSVIEGEKVTLAYQFKKGDVWRYQLREKGTQESISEASDTLGENNSSLWKHYRITETFDDGSALMEVVVDRFQLNFKMYINDELQKTIVYDTATENEPPPEFRSVKKSIGKPFAKVKMTASGEIIEMNFLQETSANDQEQTKQRQGLPILFPKTPVSVGEYWSDKLTVNLAVTPVLKKEYTVQTIYQLNKVDENIATIELKTIVQPRLTNPVLRGQMMRYLPSGTIEFDMNQGRILTRSEVIDRREVGVGGPKTAMQVLNRKMERLIEGDQKVSQSTSR